MSAEWTILDHTTGVVHEILDYLQEVETRLGNMPLSHPDQALAFEDLYVPMRVRGVEGEQEWEQIRSDKRTLLLGPSDVGKTTLLRAEGRRRAREAAMGLQTGRFGTAEIMLPMFIPLRELVEEKGDLLEGEAQKGALWTFLQHNYGRAHQPSEPRHITVSSPRFWDFVDEKLRAGNCFLLFDALDEIPEEKREEFWDRFRRFTRSYRCPFLLTAWDGRYKKRELSALVGEEVPTWQLIGFDLQQINVLIEKWFVRRPADGQLLWQQLRHNQYMSSLAQIPFMLTLICQAFWERSVLPDRRVDLFEQWFDELWDQQQQGQNSQLPTDTKIQLLEHLALHFSPRKELPEVPLYGVIRRFLTINDPRDYTPEDILAEFSKFPGILTKKARTYYFLHHTLQAYLAARALANSWWAWGQSWVRSFWDKRTAEIMNLTKELCPWRPIVASGVIMACVMSIGLQVVLHPAPPPSPVSPIEHMSIAVMPFTASSGPKWMPANLIRFNLSAQLTNIAALGEAPINVVSDAEVLTPADARRLGVKKRIEGIFVADNNDLYIKIAIVDSNNSYNEYVTDAEGALKNYCDVLENVASDVMTHLKVHVAKQIKKEISCPPIARYRLLLAAEGAAPSEGQKRPPAPPRPQSEEDTLSFLPDWEQWFGGGTAWAEETGLPAAGAGPEQEILSVLEEYRRAYETKDLALLDALYDGLTPEQRQANEEYLASMETLKVVVRDVNISVEGNKAIANYTREDNFVDEWTGEKIQLELRLTRVFVRAADGTWKMTLSQE